MSGNSLMDKWRVCCSVVFCALVLVAAPGPAEAQVSSEKAAAEALFDQGVELLKAGDYGRACEKLESSQRIDPGIGTLLYLGDCYERLGRTASAWATFREAASKAEAAGESERARVGGKRADALELRLSRVTIRMAPENKEIPELVVLESGREMNRALWGTAVPVDPGELKVVVQAPGYESFQAMITIKEATSDNSLDIPPLVSLPQVAENEGAVGASDAARPEDRGGSGDARRLAGYILGGAGIVGIGVGSTFGVFALSKKTKYENRCEAGCTEEGAKLSEEAVNAARVSTIGFIAGGVLLAGGIVLVVTSPKTRKTAHVEINPTFGGAHLTLGGSF